MMPDPISVLLDQRNNFIRRLIRKSPLLRFLPDAYRQDICALFTDVIVDASEVADDQESRMQADTAWIVLRSLFSLIPRPLSIGNPAGPFKVKCQKIKRAAEAQRGTVGETYIGYPLVFTPTRDGGFVLAPLFLCPISFAASGDKMTLDRLRSDPEGQSDKVAPPADVRFNHLFAAWLRQETGISLDWKEEEITWIHLPQMIDRLLQPWKQCDRTFSCSGLEPIRPNSENYFQSRAALNMEPKLIESAVIGYATFYGLSILDDLNQLEKRLREDPENCGGLQRFISPRSSKVNGPTAEPLETGKWLVANADPFQEAVLWRTRESRLVVMHAPPGTGRSQTIVNLIADRLEAEKVVAVISPKRSALEDILAGLREAGLSDLAELVEDPSKDRLKIIQRIRDIEHDDNCIPFYLQRSTICENLLDREKQLNIQTIALNETLNDARLRYGDLLATLHQIEKDHGIHMHGDLQGFYQKFREPLLVANIEELHKELAATDAFINVYGRCRYEQNPWRTLVRQEVQQGELVTLNAWLSEMAELAATLEDVAPKRPVHAEAMAYLAEHPWGVSCYLSLLPDTLRETQQRFGRLASLTRRIASWLPEEDVKSLLNIARSDLAIAPHYQVLRDNTCWLRDIGSINRQLQQNPLLKLLYEDCRQRMDAWPYIVEAAAAQSWLDEIEARYHFTDPQDIRNQRQSLKSWLMKKQETDRLDIQSRFGRRVFYKNQLHELGLLRLWRADGYPPTSLRELYGSECVQKLRPVLLATPEAASAILPMTPGLLDLLIIDEAAPMFTADALPMLYRARSVVVAGDRMQLSPKGLAGIADDHDTTEENIPKADTNRLVPAAGEYDLLHAAEYAVGSPKQFRIRYAPAPGEMLRFANQAFYGGRLIVPVCNRAEFLGAPMILCQVDGLFQDGINEREAKEVMEKVKGILKATPSLSVGVVTFHVKQRDRIEEALYESAEQESDFREMLERKGKEGKGVFVQTAEHLDGNRRDLIVLSTTYDGKEGNFGPVSKREEGRKVLNAVIACAGSGIMIISSIDINRISWDKERINNEHDYLFMWICYARAIDQGDDERAREILLRFGDPVRSGPARPHLASLFAGHVAEFLNTKGFHLDQPVGEGCFRIDIGVKRHAADPRYLCGIECDGRQFYRGWKARMNDIFRQDILEQFGWKIIRVFSQEWYGNRALAQEALIEQIAQLC